MVKKKTNSGSQSNSKVAHVGDYADMVGRSVFVRSVSMYFTGHLREERAGVLVLDDAAWVADTGRFSVALSSGVLVEVEPYPGAVYVAKGAIVDVSAWNHPLPRQVK